MLDDVTLTNETTLPLRSLRNGRVASFGVVTNITYIQGASKVVSGWYDNEDYLGKPKYKSYSIYYYKLMTNIIIHHGGN